MANMDDESVQWILDAISKIRCRKQRPSVERIQSALQLNKHSLTETDLSRLLNVAVLTGKILKYENKGLISYKVASKCTLAVKGRQKEFDRNVSDDDSNRLVISVIQTLGKGCSIEMIMRHIQDSRTAIEFEDEGEMKRMIHASCKKLSKSGHLSIHGGYYCLPDAPKKKFDQHDRLSNQKSDHNSKESVSNKVQDNFSLLFKIF